MNNNNVFKYGKTGIIVYCTPLKIHSNNIPWPLMGFTKLYLRVTFFLSNWPTCIFFSNILNLNHMLGGKNLIFPRSFSSIKFLFLHLAFTKNKIAAQYFRHFDSVFWQNPYLVPNKIFLTKFVWLLVICTEDSRDKSCSKLQAYSLQLYEDTRCLLILTLKLSETFRTASFQNFVGWIILVQRNMQWTELLYLLTRKNAVT